MLPIELPPLELAPLLTLDVELGAPVSVGNTPRGEIRLVPIVGGTFVGKDVRGRILPGGADWQNVRRDSGLEIRAHYLLETDERERIEVKSEGLRAARPEVLARLARGENVPASEYYFRTAIRLTTASERLHRYNDVLAVCRGERRTSMVHLEVHEVL